MPSKVTVLDSNTGLSSLVWGVAAREMVANDPGRYSITDTSAEVAALNGSGLKVHADRLVSNGGVLSVSSR